MHHLKFTSTVRDLQDAYEAEQVQNRGTWFYYGWGSAVLAAIWIAGAYLFVISGESHAMRVFWIAVGLWLLWAYGITPYLAKRKIRLENPSEQDIDMKIRPDGIFVDLRGIGPYKREWSEFLGATLTSTGILLYFDDDSKNWLPRRIFSDRSDMKKTYDFLETCSGHANRNERIRTSRDS